MKDEIHIQDLLLRTIVGINPEERTKRQEVLLNIWLETDVRRAAESDDIAHAVNYRTIAKEVIRLVEGSRFHLVERLASEVARLCLQHPGVERVRVRLEKPGALRFARSVGVTLERSRADFRPHALRRVYLVLGSNIAPERNLPEAVRRLAGRVVLRAVSPVYETEPVGATQQPRFLNAAVLVETPLEPAALREEVLRPLEAELGRMRTADKYAPRTCDVDIALCDDIVMEVGPWRVPDPHILRYAHVAVPLADLAPALRHPETGQTLREIAASLDRRGIRPRPDLSLWPTRFGLQTPEGA